MRHDAAHALRQEIVAGARRVGSGLAEAGDRAIDQAREVVLDLLVGEVVARHVADLEILDEHVAARDQQLGDLLAFGLRDVERDRPLVAVDGEVVGAFAGVLAVAALDERRAPFARVVALAGPLDLDDVGAQIAEHLRGGRAGQDAGQVENADAGQWSRHVMPLESVRESPRTVGGRGGEIKG